MMRKLCLVVGIVLCVGALFPAYAGAVDLLNNPCNAAGGVDTSNSAVCTDGTNTTNPLTGSGGLIIRIANIIALIAGLAAVVVIIIAAWTFITSGGDAAKVRNAKSALAYALAGVAVISVADVIIRFALSNL